jgi:hypothetical protein
MITPALTRMKANSVPMLTSSTMVLSGTNAASSAMPMPNPRVSRTGVPVRGCTSASHSGMRPSRAIANMILVWPYRVVSMTLVIATRAPNAVTAAAPVMPAPASSAWASGASLACSSLAGSTPTAVTDTSTYTMVAISSEPQIAIGRSLLGFLASSLPVETASKPMKAKKMTEAAVTMPSRPLGANGLRLSLSKTVAATTMNSSSTASLTNTMMVFVLAVSRAPFMSRAVTATTMRTAGRLKVPPCSGEVDSASGILIPKAVSRNSLRLPPQPTATAATAMPYSRMRSSR